MAGAATLYREELDGCTARYGRSHPETEQSARNLVKVLRKQGEQAEAQKVAAEYEVVDVLGADPPAEGAAPAAGAAPADARST